MNISNNPYSTTFDSSPPKLNMDVSGQSIKYKDEEMMQKSPRNLPFTGEVLKEYLSVMYINLLSVKKAIDTTSKEPNTDQEAIEEALAVIKEIGQKITIDLSLCIAKLYL